MKKLTLGGKNLVQIANGWCNFCGEHQKVLRGFKELETSYLEPKTEYKKTISDYEKVTPLFGPTYKKIVGGVEHETVVTGWKEKIETECADVCLSCVKELYSMIKEVE